MSKIEALRLYRGEPRIRFLHSWKQSSTFAKASADSLLGLPAEAEEAAKAGGASRDRTDDLKLAKLALSQLSYGPAAQP